MQNTDYKRQIAKKQNAKDRLPGELQNRKSVKELERLQRKISKKNC